MEPRGDQQDDDRRDVPGLRKLVERGVVVPASRRLSQALAAQPSLRIEDAQAKTSVLDRQRAERA
jgi:hypothetical protein